MKILSYRPVSAALQNIYRPTLLKPTFFSPIARSFPPRLIHSHAAKMSTDASVPKRQKLESPVIGTHNGHFHADEALAVYLLRTLPQYNSSPLVRTRDPAKLAECHTVVDVGGEYDAERNRFDHHQRGFDATFPGHSTKLSAAGLVYLHHGKAIIAVLTGLDAAGDEVRILYEKTYDDLIEAFDANDNGVSAYDTRATDAAGIAKRFDDTRFSIASVVGRLNHAGRDADAEAALSAEERQRLEDERFLKASAFVGEQFVADVADAKDAWLPSRVLVRQAYADRHNVHASGKVVVLPHRNGGLPWADHLFTAEDEAGGDDAARVLYVLFPESGEADSKWRIRAVSTARGQFTNRKDLPDAWKGLRDEELSKVSGVEGGVFVHAAGFIGGNVTLDGAKAMAVKAVEA